MRPSRILRAEGLAVLVLSLATYAQYGAAWWVYAVFFLLPDLAMLGYLVSPRIGSYTYNAAHTYIGPAALLVVGVWSGFALTAGLIWAGHIGADRLLGFGLKYPDAFSHTHLSSR